LLGIENPKRAGQENLQGSRKPTLKDRAPIEGFALFGATRRKLRQFLSAGHELPGFMREMLIANPGAA
jgi:hypothetical protein